jgi:ABC-type nickel/cobalt efflux system permease component RcnA
LFELSSQISSVLLLGFLLGLKHATDADHVVAVTAILSSSNNVWKSIWIGISWGIGHSIPLIALGLIILFIKESFIEYYQNVAPYFEIAVGAMLIILGLQVLRNISRGNLHLHMHINENQPHVHIHATHTHRLNARQAAKHGKYNHGVLSGLLPLIRPKSFVVGLVHSLAGSAAVLILLIPTINSNLMGIGYLVLFGIGTIISMSAVTLLLSFPLKTAFRFPLAHKLILSIAGLANLALGSLLIAEVISGYEIIRL